MGDLMKRYLEEQRLYEMSNLFPADTGLDFKLWITTKSGREKHNARIKLSNSNGEIVVTIFNEPEVKSKKGKIVISGKQWKQLVWFIKLNKDTLLDHWNGDISSKQFGDQIVSV